MNNVYVSHYADDFIVYAANNFIQGSMDLQPSLDVLSASLSDIGLEVSPTKSLSVQEGIQERKC